MTRGCGAMARPKNCWSLKVGAPGNAVTLYERRPGGALYLRWWVSGTEDVPGRWAKRALKHDNRDVGEQTAKEVAASLLASTLATATGKATVTEVLACYERDVCAHQKGHGPHEAKRRIALWFHVLGGQRDVNTIDFPTMDRFSRERRAGAIKLEKYSLSAKPSNRTVGADIEFLRAALNHACTVVRPNGARMLRANPIDGYELPKNRRPRRPVVSYDRFLKVLEKADAADSQRLFGGFMALVEGLGWRVSAICALRASDVDLKASPSGPHGRIYRRAEFDKEGMSGWVPMSESVRAGIDRIRAVNPAIGEWPLFPAPRARVAIPQGKIPKAWSRHHARKLLERAEALAKLDKVEGGDFHPYRRKWSTERKHLPDVDVAASGGWADTRALKMSYQQVDEATMLAVVSEPTKLRDAKPTPNSETA